YTSIAALNKVEADKGFTTSTYKGFARKTKAKPAKIPTAKAIDFDISSANFNVHYDYNTTTNSYDRVLGGVAHTDANNGKQISPKVVIALITSYGIHADGQHSVYGTIGTGQAIIFQDGEVI